MFARWTPPVTPEDIRVRARAVAKGYLAEVKRRHEENPGLRVEP
jgi:hypothetical protein